MPSTAISAEAKAKVPAPWRSQRNVEVTVSESINDKQEIPVWQEERWGGHTFESDQGRSPEEVAFTWVKAGITRRSQT